MTTQQQSVRDRVVETARSLAPALAERAARHDRENSFPFENYEDLIRAGYHTATVPERLGGMGAGLHDLCLGQEQLGIGDGSTSLGIGMHLSLLGRLAEEDSWPEELWERVCGDVVERGALINSAATEPGMGSPSRGGAPVTTARRVSGGWEISGRKSFTTIAPVATYFIVLAWIEEEERRGSFLVRRDQDGVSVAETWDALGMRATGSHDLVLERVRVPEESYIRPRDSRPAPGPGRAWGALTLGATYLGVAQAARDYAANFARSRTPTGLGRPISELEHVREGIGRMELSIRSARAVLFETARTWQEEPERRDELAPDIAASKYLATNCAVQVTDLAMRLVGGSALSRRFPLERLFRDARAGLYNPPADHETLVLLGRWVLGERPQLR